MRNITQRIGTMLILFEIETITNELLAFSLESYRTATGFFVFPIILALHRVVSGFPQGTYGRVELRAVCGCCFCVPHKSVAVREHTISYG